MKIVVFEDIAADAQAYVDKIRSAMGEKHEAVRFVAQKTYKECMHEKMIEEELNDIGPISITLIVADRDLSGLEQYSGLSEPTVRRVADRLGIPECGYARGETEDFGFEDAELREGRITVYLAPSVDEFVKQIVSIASGFDHIQSEIAATMEALKRPSPGHVLAKILGKPEYADKIALYASGDQNRLVNVLRIRKSSGKDEKQRRIACLLGYWLWDSVLRYPGVVVNEIAAGSYLNINDADFKENAVQDLFKAARYSGPFHEAKGKLWWRGMLDDIVSESKAADGREFAASKLNRDVRRSECCEDASKTAGYYCILSKKPVSAENSKSGLAWLPRGADLARVSTKKYQEIGPWL